MIDGLKTAIELAVQRACGGAGALCPDCSKTNPADPDDVPAMPGGFIPDLS